MSTDEYVPSEDDVRAVWVVHEGTVDGHPTPETRPPSSTVSSPVSAETPPGKHSTEL